MSSKIRRGVGIIICIAGIALIFASNYIKQQVEAGKIEIAEGERKVKQGQTLFGLNPVTKEIGQKAIFDPAQGKIAAGKADVAKYEKLAGQLMIAGIVLIAAGAIIALIPARKR